MDNVLRFSSRLLLSVPKQIKTLFSLHTHAHTCINSFVSSSNKPRKFESNASLETGPSQREPKLLLFYATILELFSGDIISHEKDEKRQPSFGWMELLSIFFLLPSPCATFTVRLLT